MTTQRNYRHETITFICDECGEEYEADTDDFRDALDDFKQHGGRAVQDCGEWLHMCRDCG